MITTPFDNLSLYDFDSSNFNQRKIALTIRILSLSKELRIRYLNLIEYSKIANNKFERIKHHVGSSTERMTNSDILVNQTEALGPVLAYHDFISTLNSHGRMLDQFGLTIPKYYRIRFYRNIVVEHWDKYLNKSCLGVTGWSTKKGMITVPIHSLKANMPDPGKSLWGEIIIKLKSVGITNTMKWEDTINYEKYTEEIFNSLEQLDSQLNTVNINGKSKIPPKLISMLYDYALPIPISNVEEYSRDLSIYLEEFIAKILE